jgi:hypothetical protein
MENKTGRYLKYAVGEILLVVIGILIALSINNWNTNRIERNQQIKIFNSVLNDIENDIQELSATISYLDSVRPIFQSVRNDSINPDLLDKGISRILAKYYLTSLNKTGVNQLKSTTNKDSLSLQVIEIYDLMENTLILPHEEKLMDETYSLTEIYREYPWYSEWMGKTIMKDNSSKELQDYFLYSMEYKHRVIYFYQLLYNNYYKGIATSISSLNSIKKQIESRINEK